MYTFTTCPGPKIRDNKKIPGEWVPAWAAAFPDPAGARHAFRWRCLQACPHGSGARCWRGVACLRFFVSIGRRRSHAPGGNGPGRIWAR